MKYHFIVDTSRVELNKFYSFSGIVNPDSKIEVLAIQEHPLRKFKYLCSLLSFIIILYFIMKYIRFDKNLFTLTVKEKVKKA